MKVFENSVRETADAAAEFGATVETRTIAKVGVSHPGRGTKCQYSWAFSARPAWWCLAPIPQFHLRNSRRTWTRYAERRGQ
jgi:hypothetical protein